MSFSNDNRQVLFKKKKCGRDKDYKYRQLNIQNARNVTFSSHQDIPYSEKNNKLFELNKNSIRNQNNYVQWKIFHQQRTEETKIYSENACKTLFYNRPECIVRAWFVYDVISRFKEVLCWMANNRKAYHIVSDKDLSKISDTEHHGGVCFLVKKRHGKTVQQWIDQEKDSDCILALENVENPHNIGAIIRSCAHFNIKGILLKNVKLLESGAAMRTAEGGAEYVQPIISDDNMLSSVKKFRKVGYTIIATSSNCYNISLFKTKLPRKTIFILGKERGGISDAMFAISDLIVSIDGSSNMASLNVSVATGIFLAEWWRQNRS